MWCVVVVVATSDSKRCFTPLAAGGQAMWRSAPLLNSQNATSAEHHAASSGAVDKDLSVLAQNCMHVRLAEKSVNGPCRVGNLVVPMSGR